jgi:hypothetical protein
VYKLEYKEFVERTFKSHEPIPQGTPWCHVITDKGSKKSERAVFDAALAHMSNYGMKIVDHPEAFKLLPDSSKEQGSGKYHTALEIDHGKVPTDHGLFNLTGIGSFMIDDETNERAKIWFKPELLTETLNVCNKCYMNNAACRGHGAPANDGKRKMSAADNENHAKMRMAKKAAKANTFKFSTHANTHAPATARDVL